MKCINCIHHKVCGIYHEAKRIKGLGFTLNIYNMADVCGNFLNTYIPKDTHNPENQNKEVKSKNG